MNKKEYTALVQSKANTLGQVLTYDIINRISYYFKTKDRYAELITDFRKYQTGKNKNFALKTLLDHFHYDMHFLQTLVGQERVLVEGHSRRLLKDVKTLVAADFPHLWFIGKKDVHYSSGKTFSHPSMIILKDDKDSISMVEDPKYTDYNSDYYTLEARKTIFDVLDPLKENMKDFKRMTKKQKEQYRKEYEAGQHMLSLEEYEKDQAKKKRRADKRALTIATKAANASITNYAKLVTENTQLKADREELEEKVQALEEKVQKLETKLEKVCDIVKLQQKDIVELKTGAQLQTPKPQPETNVQTQPIKQPQTPAPQPKPQPQIQTPEDDIPDVDGQARILNELVAMRVITITEARMLAPFYSISSSLLADSDYKSLDINMSKEQLQSRYAIFNEVYTKFRKVMDKDTLRDIWIMREQTKSRLTPVDGMGDTQAARERGEKDHQFHMDEPVKPTTITICPKPNQDGLTFEEQNNVDALAL